MKKRVRAKLLKRDNYSCLRCGVTEPLTIDHIVPVAVMKKLGIFVSARVNTQTLCANCNIIKNHSIISYRKDEEKDLAIELFKKLIIRRGVDRPLERKRILKILRGIE